MRWVQKVEYLSEEHHPVRPALCDHVVWGDQVDQVEAAVEQKTFQTFGEVFVEEVTVGQVHGA